MQIGDLIALLERPEVVRLLSAAQRDELAALLHGLKRVQGVELEALIRATHTIKLPSTKREAKPAAATVSEAIEALHQLKQEIPSWKSPDYPEVRRRVNAACGAIRKDDVVEVCRGFLGKSHSGKSKPDLLEALAQPMIRQLEIRFMNAGA